MSKSARGEPSEDNISAGVGEDTEREMEMLSKRQVQVEMATLSAENQAGSHEEIVPDLESEQKQATNTE